MTKNDYIDVIKVFVAQFKKAHGLADGDKVAHVDPLTLNKIIAAYESQAQSKNSADFQHFYEGSIFPLVRVAKNTTQLAAWFDTFFSREGVLDEYDKDWFLEMFKFFEPRILDRGSRGRMASIPGRRQLTGGFLDGLKAYASKHNFKVFIEDKIVFQGHREAFKLGSEF